MTPTARSPLPSCTDPLIGAHVSVAGGLDLAPERARAVGCRCFQIFTKSNRQWKAPRLRDDEIERFRSECRRLALAPVVGHCAYLINLAAPEGALRTKSLEAFRIEVERAERIGLPHLVVHPGMRPDADEGEGVRRVVEALDTVLDRVPEGGVTVCLETTAGASSVGCRFEHLAAILRASQHSRRLGVCFDTCHAFAAGYDLRTRAAYRRTFDQFDRIVGLDRLRVFHLNDALCDLDSHRDRHAHIGHGRIGREGFRLLLRDRRFARIPKILETPKGRRGKSDWDVINLNLLRRLTLESAPSA